MDKIIEELEELCGRLGNATFTGIGTSKYYPPESKDAYYRMEYSPARLVLRHKSPSALIEERFEVTYRGIDGYNCAAIHIYADDRLYKSYASKEDFDNLYSSDEGQQLLIKYLFKDPRVALASAKTIREIPPPDTFDKAYQIVVLKNTHDPNFGIVVIAEFFLKERVLCIMRLRKFLGKKEMTSQNMDIAFHF